jgi:hypothetical protein
VVAIALVRERREWLIAARCSSGTSLPDLPQPLASSAYNAGIQLDSFETLSASS